MTASGANDHHNLDTIPVPGDAARPFLSIVIPAYNEEARLPGTLRTATRFLAGRTYSSEIIVVDDGSTDRTAETACQGQNNAIPVRVISLPHRGKAVAVRAGVNAARGEQVLFTDADLSTPIDSVELLLEKRAAGYDIAIGSREGAAARRIGEPSYRHLMGRAFNWLVQALAVRGVQDTQCGFKLFSHEAASSIFPRLLLHQYGPPPRGPRVSAFDVEILYLARRSGFRVAEVPVVWTHMPGSKVRPGIDSFRMFLDVVRLRWYAHRGKYN